LDWPPSRPFLFDDVFQGFFRDLDAVSAGPRFRLESTADGALLSAELPGLAREDVSLTVENGEMTVTAERKFDAPEGYAFVRRERTPMRISRTFTLAPELDQEKAEARMENGILEVRIPRRPESLPRQIPVQ
jgi:HSP20 family protein